MGPIHECGKWFKRIGNVVVHLEVHSKTEWKCSECNHFTTCEKYFKDHIKSRRHETDEIDLPYKCSVCNKCLLYREQLSQHKKQHV